MGLLECFANRGTVIFHNLSTQKAMKSGKSYSQLKKELVETEVMNEIALNEGLDELIDYCLIDRILNVGEVDSRRLIHHRFKINIENASGTFECPRPQWIQDTYDKELKQAYPQYFRE